MLEDSKGGAHKRGGFDSKEGARPRVLAGGLHLAHVIKGGGQNRGGLC